MRPSTYPPEPTAALREAVAQRRARKAVAVNATARELACLIYLMVTQGTEYVERGMEAHERNRTQRAMISLTQRARQLGFALVAIDENQPTANVAISTA